jgi:(1->4)-alpha-D-glucan 1-alpha-D-glucosylmutase
VVPSSRVVDPADAAALAPLADPVREVLGLRAQESEASEEFVVRFQQTSGAVMAKGVEDTALYRFVRLLALNEVGGDPDRFGVTVDEFHRANEERAERFPRALLTAQTHDTKRSADVRARLGVLAGIAPAWSAASRAWHDELADLRRGGAPDWTEELFVYQTLIGAWPISAERLSAYLRKALREAKRHSSWVEPNEEWEDAVIAFATALTGDDRFLARFLPLFEHVAAAGERASLAEVVLRCTSPGVPDVYQGDELWSLALVDPDNRRAVDWDRRRASWEALARGASPPRELLKLDTLTRLLALRGRRPGAFDGGYRALPAAGACAFQRGDDVRVWVRVRGLAPAPGPPAGWVAVLGLSPDLGIAVWERETAPVGAPRR